MWTYNAYAEMNNKIGNSTYQGTSREGGYGVKGWNSTTSVANSTRFSFLYPVNSVAPPSSGASTTAVYFWIGGGDTPATLEDCNLKSVFLNSEVKWIESDSTALVFDTISKKYKTTAHTILQNISSNALTVKEIGIVRGPTDFNVNCVLYYREVLDSPITVPAGEYLCIEMDIETPAYVPTTN